MDAIKKYEEHKIPTETKFVRLLTTVTVLADAIWKN